MQPLRKKCSCSEIFWSVFSCIWTEYGEIICISPYLVRLRENTDQKNCEYGHFFTQWMWLLKCHILMKSFIPRSLFSKINPQCLRIVMKAYYPLENIRKPHIFFVAVYTLVNLLKRLLPAYFLGYIGSFSEQIFFGTTLIGCFWRELVNNKLKSHHRMFHCE